MLRTAGLLSVLCLLAPSLALAYSISLVDGDSGEIVRWHVKAVSYRLHSSGSADIVDGSDLNAVRAGWKQWNDVSCADISFVEQSTTTNKNVMSVGGAPNDINEVVWIESSAWSYGQFVLGITNTSFFTNGEIVEADIAFNGYQNKWSTTGKSGTVDVLNVAAHEQGHFFGAQHNLGGWAANNPPTMAPKADPSLKSATIEQDDKNCICFLYPNGGFPCSSDDDCPLVNDKNQFGEEYYAAKITCQNAICGGKSFEIPEGTGVLGQECASDFDCKKPLFCQPTGNGSACAKNCNNDSDCGSGFTCFPYSNSPGGVCLPSQGGGGTGGGTGGPVATKDAGDACNSPQECKSGLCVGSFGSTAYYCRNACKPGQGDCGAGESCSQLQGSSQGACLPSQGSSATKAPGEACQSPAECISGLCVGNGPGAYKCRESCTPALGDCPELHACFALVGNNSGACIPVDPKKELGELCEGDSDCLSDFCLGVQGDDHFYCSTLCNAAQPCQCGMDCASFQGGVSYCTLNGEIACTPSGNPCDSAAECISQTCISGICRDPCKVTAGGCPPGAACKRFKAGSTNGVCEPSGDGNLGTPCGVDSDCASLVCELSACALACDPLSTICGAGDVCFTPAGATLTICAPDPNPPPTTGNTTGGETAGTTEAGTTTGGGTGGATGGTTGGEVDGGNGGSTGCSHGSDTPATAWLTLALLGGLGWLRTRRRK